MDKVFNNKGEEIQIEHFHPSTLINEEMESMSVDATTLSGWTGIDYHELISLLDGKSSFTPETSQKIEVALGTPKEMIMNMQIAFDLDNKSKPITLTKLQLLALLHESNQAGQDYSSHLEGLCPWPDYSMHKLIESLSDPEFLKNHTDELIAKNHLTLDN